MNAIMRLSWSRAGNGPADRIVLNLNGNEQQLDPNQTSTEVSVPEGSWNSATVCCETNDGQRGTPASTSFQAPTYGDPPPPPPPTPDACTSLSAEFVRWE